MQRHFSTLVPVALALGFLALVVGIMALAPSVFTRNLGGFPYADHVARLNAPDWMRPLTGFDGVQYLIIAENRGYFTYQQAYFPLYPLVIGVLGRYVFMGDTPWAALFVNIISLSIALITLRALWIKLGGSPTWRAYWLILLLPGSFFFVSVYTESFFIMLVLLALYAASCQKYRTMAILGVLIGMTRLVGVFIAIPLGLIAYGETIPRTWPQKISRAQLKNVLLAMSPLLGLGIYMVYLLITTGDALAFVSAQKAFNNNRSTSIILLPQVIYRYIQIFITAQKDVAFFVASVEFALFGIYSVLLLLEARALYLLHRSKKALSSIRSGVLLFSIMNLLLPTISGTLSSIPRYGLLSLSIIPFISTLRRPYQIALACIFMALNLCMLILFTLAWFVS